MDTVWYFYCLALCLQLETNPGFLRDSRARYALHHTHPLFCFLGDWVPPHDHINRMGNVHTCITWSHEQKWDCTPWLFGVSKYFLGLLGFCPLWLLSLGLLSYGVFVHWPFLCPTTWSYEQNLDCAHLYNVISWTEMLLYSLIVGVLNYFLFCCFCPLWFLSFRAFVHLGSCLSAYMITWTECWLA